MITLHGTKQKEETLGMIAQAWVDALLGETIEIIQPNELGGKSLEKVIKTHFPDAMTDSRNKARHIILTKTKDTPDIIETWLNHTKLRFVDEIGFYSLPGLFGWNKIDQGSNMLLDYIGSLSGKGADFGCGYGFLSKNILLKNSKIDLLYCFDYDYRAYKACKKNIMDDRAVIAQADCSQTIPDLPPFNFVVMNPPFHEGAKEDKTLGQKFIETAAYHLKKKGELWLVANRHLPYEKTLEKNFSCCDRVADHNGFKIIKALK
jgi:16S rRNA (guanine1207-N2)-methyltransferase